MVDDLISSKRLDGLTSNEVLSLLGPPADKGFPYGATNCHVHWKLGPCRCFIMRIDSEWLFITFDQAGVVEKYWLYED